MFWDLFNRYVLELKLASISHTLYSTHDPIFDLAAISAFVLRISPSFGYRGSGD